jgi:hypothetical protein
MPAGARAMGSEEGLPRGANPGPRSGYRVVGTVTTGPPPFAPTSEIENSGITAPKMLLDWMSVSPASPGGQCGDARPGSTTVSPTR